jgi:hypothetical protein
MFSFYLTKILLIFFASYVHVPLFVPLITCALPKLTQTQEKNSRMFVLPSLFYIINTSVGSGKYGILHKT